MNPDEERFFEQLYQENFGKLMRYARVHMDPFRAEELVQDTFHDALQKIQLLAGHENPYGWLMTTLKYKINNYQRSHQKELLRLISLNSELASDIPAPDSIDDILEENEDQRSLAEKLQHALSERELHIVRRMVYESATHKELAEEMGISVWASQKRLERIRNKLEKIFPDHR